VKSKNTAQRTCIGCRTKKPKKELVRITLNSKGNIVFDKNKQIGRGAYLCKNKVQTEACKVNKKCLEQAIKKNTFKYAFKKIPSNKIKKIKTAFNTVKIQTSKSASSENKATNCNGNGPC